MRVYWAPASSMRISSSVWSLSAETFDSQPSSSSFIKTRQRCFRICRATSWRDAYSSGWYLVRNLSTTISMHRNQNWRQWTSYCTGCPPTKQRQIDENTVHCLQPSDNSDNVYCQRAVSRPICLPSKTAGCCHISSQVNNFMPRCSRTDEIMILWLNNHGHGLNAD